MSEDGFIHSLTRERAWYLFPLWLVRHPLQAARQVVGWKTVWPGLGVVLVLGLYVMVSCFRSHLQHDYPPPAEDLEVWVATWGEFAMLPVPALNIPLDEYRRFMGIISLPITAGSWLLMGSVAHYLTRWFGGRTSFQNYLNLFAFSFFPFWFLAVIGDGLYTALLGPQQLPALRGELGPVLLLFFKHYPPLLYTLLFGLGAVYNSLVTYGAALKTGRLRPWQAGVIGWLTFIPPLVLVTLFYR